MKKFIGLSLSEVVFIMPINVKMPTIVCILTFMSRINFVLSRVEHGKSFITSGPGAEKSQQLNQPSSIWLCVNICVLFSVLNAK